MALERVVFSLLMEELLLVCPLLRKHVYQQVKIVNFIYDFMKLHTKPEEMLNSFELSSTIFPVYIPTTPSLPVHALKITDAKNIGETRKMNRYQVVHNNPNHSIQFIVNITQEANYNNKAL
jgi:hypothetical protein